MNLRELFHAIRCYPKLDSGTLALSLVRGSASLIDHSLLLNSLIMHARSDLPHDLLRLPSSTLPLSYLAEHLRTTFAAAPPPFHPILV